MLSIEELEEVFEEIRTGESTDFPFSWKGTDHGQELRSL